MLDCLLRLDRARHHRARRQLHQHEGHALVLVRQEAGGQAQEQHRHGRDDGQIKDCVGDPGLGEVLQRAFVVLHPAVEVAVEPAEEAFLLAVRLGVGLQQGGAERRRQGQGGEDRQDHGRDDGHRELAVDHPGRTAEEGHRQEDRGQHQHDADQRAGDLLHGLAGGLDRRQPLLVHDPLDVLHHHDGVVDQQPDGQHHGEHGQRVDGIVQRRQHAEGAEQHDRHRDGRDQRGAPVLQEDEHDHEHQDHRLDQGAHHVLDGEFDEGRGVVGEGDLHVGREARGDLVDLGLHGLCGAEGVGAGRQLDAHAAGGLAVEAGGEGVTVLAHLRAAHVVDEDAGAVRIGLQHDVGELLGRLQARLAGDHRIQLLVAGDGELAELARGDLGVLGHDGGLHVGDGQAVIVQLVGIEPDPHGVLGAEQGGVAHPCHPAQRVEQLAVHQVGEVGAVVRAGGPNRPPCRAGSSWWPWPPRCPAAAPPGAGPGWRAAACSAPAPGRCPGRCPGRRSG